MTDSHYDEESNHMRYQDDPLLSSFSPPSGNYTSPSLETSLYENAGLITHTDSALSLPSDADLLSGNEAYKQLDFLLTHQDQDEGSPLPTLEEFDKGVDFKLEFKTSKNRVQYSEKLCKVYVRINTSFYVNVSFQQGNGQEKWYLRATLVYSEELSEPVKRCHNHLNQDVNFHKNPPPDSVFHVLRCQNEETKYLGSGSANSVKDRFALLIPLRTETKPDNESLQSTLIALQYVCQNSCIGRKQTAIIFTLQNENYEDIAKKVFKIKGCSSPKRDMSKEEELESNTNKSGKRKAPTVDIPVGKKILRTKIKEEPEESVASNNDSLVKTELRAHDADTLLDILQFAHDRYAGLIVKDPSGAERYQQHLDYYTSEINKLTAEQQLRFK